MSTETETKSQFHDEREAILDVMRDNDRQAWERFCTCKLFKRHAAFHALSMHLERQLELAGRLRFEADWDEALIVQIDVYLTIYRLINDPNAQEKAEALVEESGLRGLRNLI